MPKIYTDKLIADTILTFKEENGVILSRDEAVAILDTLAGLYLAFTEKGAPRAP